MNWLVTLLTADSVAHSVISLSVVIVLGLALGSIRAKGLNLGVAGVLFAGLALGHFGLRVNHEVLEFVREFGLILFVFTIGLQVGPGFFASLKRQGLVLNGLAALTVLLGALVTVAIPFGAAVPAPAAAGLFSGATTNTPSLAAAGQALRQMPELEPGMLELPGLAYAVAYPFGIVGTILTLLIVKRLFRIDVEAERKALEDAEQKSGKEIEAVALKVENPNLFGAPISRIPGLAEARAVISRVHRGGTTELARPDFVLRDGDTVLAVAPKENLPTLRLAIGPPSPLDIRRPGGSLTTRRVVVTRKSVLGTRIEDLQLLGRFDVNVTRLTRAGQEFTATPDLALQFGDLLMLVGREEGVAEAARALGNSAKDLSAPQLLPIFAGIALGILAGSLPVALPGLPAPVKLGLAGGPLLVAILLSRLGNVGPLVWYMPPGANTMVREMGIALFLACVGLHAGDSFVEVLRGDGLRWLLLATAITLLPILAAGLLARAVWKINYVRLCGLVAGSMTDPPALAFAHLLTQSERAAVAYATVYPLTMILRIFTAQILILLLMR